MTICHLVKEAAKKVKNNFNKVKQKCAEDASHILKRGRKMTITKRIKCICKSTRIKLFMMKGKSTSLMTTNLKYTSAMWRPIHF